MAPQRPPAKTNTGPLNALLAEEALKEANKHPLAGKGGRAEYITRSQVGNFFTNRSQKLTSFKEKVGKAAVYGDEEGLTRAFHDGRITEKEYYMAFFSRLILPLLLQHWQDAQQEGCCWGGPPLRRACCCCTLWARQGTSG